MAAITGKLRSDMARYDLVTGTTNVDVSMGDLRGRGGGIILNWSAVYVGAIVQCLVYIEQHLQKKSKCLQG